MVQYALYRGYKVPLNKPIREIKNNKQKKVYTINPKTGKINIIRFGDATMRLKSHIPKRQKSYCHS